ADPPRRGLLVSSRGPRWLKIAVFSGEDARLALAALGNSAQVSDSDANSAVFSGGSSHTSSALSLRPSGASPKRRRRSAARPTVRPDPVAERLCRSPQAGGGGPTMTTESIAPTIDLSGNVA